MKVLFFAYPQYADFEIAHTLFLLRKMCNAKIITVTTDGNSVESLGGLYTNAVSSLSNINVTDFDLILISGGDGIKEVIDHEKVSEILTEAFELKIPIASICASALLLGKAGILKGKRFTCLINTFEKNQALFEQASYSGTDIEVESNIITAKGTAFAEFAIKVCQLLGFLKDKEQALWAFNFCKGIS